MENVSYSKNTLQNHYEDLLYGNGSIQEQTEEDKKFEEQAVEEYFHKELLKSHKKYIESRSDFTMFMAKKRYKQFLLNIVNRPFYTNLVEQFCNMSITNIFIQPEGDVSGHHDNISYIGFSINVFFINSSQTNIEIYYCMFFNKIGDISEKMTITYIDEQYTVDWAIIDYDDPLYRFMADLLEDLKSYYIQ